MQNKNPNPTKNALYQRNWYERNKEKRNEYMRQYRLLPGNKEKADAASRKALAKKDPEEVRKYHRDWYIAHKGLKLMESNNKFDAQQFAFDIAEKFHQQDIPATIVINKNSDKTLPGFPASVTFINDTVDLPDDEEEPDDSIDPSEDSCAL